MARTSATGWSGKASRSVAASAAAESAVCAASSTTWQPALPGISATCAAQNEVRCMAVAEGVIGGVLRPARRGSQGCLESLLPAEQRRNVMAATEGYIVCAASSAYAGSSSSTLLGAIVL
jgi:hypothetical protein